MLPCVVDPTTVRWLFFTLTAWLHHRDADAIAYLREENRILRAQIGRRPLPSPMTSDADLPYSAFDLDGRACAQWRTSSRLTRFSAGIASCWPENGPIRGTRADEPVCSGRSTSSWSAWRRRIPPGATRGFKARCR